MAIDKILGNSALDQVADSVFSAVSDSVSEIKAMQKRKAAENVQVVIQALKKIESDLQDKYDGVTTVIEKRVASIKDGKDGRDGANGRDGKDGRPGRDGAVGPRGANGADGRNGRDGADGVSVTEAHIDFDGSLVISLSNGRTINVGEVVAPDLADKIKVITNGGGTSQLVLDTLTSLQNQINDIAGGLDFQGTWNATTNTPALASGVGVNGYYYIVATAGSTNLDGITDWQIGDWLLFNGTVWQKIDQSNLVTSVAGRTGAVVLTTADIGGLGTIATQNANAVAITGGTATLTSLTVNDNTTLGSSNTDEVNFTARIASEFTPATNNTYDLGRNSHEWRNLYLSGTANLSGGTANGVAYLNGSKVLTTGSALTFTGANLGVGIATAAQRVHIYESAAATGAFLQVQEVGGQNAYFGVNTSGGSIQVAGANPLQFAINGSEQMRLTSTGLGIGTSSPAHKLDVRSGATPTTAFLDTTAATAYSPGSFFAGANLTIRSNANATGNGVGIRFASNANGNLEGMFGWVQNAATYGDFVWQSFNGSYAERMRLDSSGNLGLGVTPSAWGSGNNVLQVGYTGAINALSSTELVEFSSNYYSDASSVARYKASGYASRYRQANSEHRWYTAPSGTAGDAISFTQAMTLTAAGDLGVGTTSPVAPLTVNKGNVTGAGQWASSAIAVANPTNVGAYSQISFGYTVGTTNASAYIGFISTNQATNGFGDLVFGTRAVSTDTQPTERARITSGGDLLVGTTSAYAANGVTITPGFLFASKNANVSGAFDRTGSSDGDAVHFRYNGNTVGSVSVTSTATAYNTSSDYRLKNITGPITTSGAYIDSLNPVEGTWKADGSTFVGLIAHEVQEASRTQVATGVKDGEEMQGMDYSSAEIIANLIAEVKALRTRVAALESI